MNNYFLVTLLVVMGVTSNMKAMENNSSTKTLQEYHLEGINLFNSENFSGGIQHDAPRNMAKVGDRFGVVQQNINDIKGQPGYCAVVRSFEVVFVQVDDGVLNNTTKPAQFTFGGGLRSASSCLFYAALSDKKTEKTWFGPKVTYRTIGYNPLTQQDLKSLENIKMQTLTTVEYPEKAQYVTLYTGAGLVTVAAAAAFYLKNK